MAALILLAVVLTVSTQVTAGTDFSLQHSQIIFYLTSNPASQYEFYGCWCNSLNTNEENKLADETDRCCRAHHDCYRIAGAQCSIPPTNGSEYDSVFRNGTVSCMDPEDTCKFKVCLCDKLMAQCLRDFQQTFNALKYNNLSKQQCRSESLPGATITSTTAFSTSSPTSSVCQPFQQPLGDLTNCTKPKWAQQGITIAGTGVAGSSPMQLNYPMAVFIDQNDNDTLYVADRDNHRVQKFVQGSNGVGVTVAGGNGEGRGNNQIYAAYDIFVDSARNIFIADRGAQRVQKWSENSSVGVTLIALEGDYLAEGVWLNEEAGDLYVTEATVMVGSGRLTKYSLVNTTATKRTVVAPNLQVGNGLFVDQCNSAVYVADPYAKRIEKFNTSESYAGGSVVFSGFESPQDVIADCYGNLYVGESGWFKDEPPVQRINVREGRKREVVIGTHFASTRTLLHPNSLAFDSQWNLYVADMSKARVQKFLFEGGDLYC